MTRTFRLLSIGMLVMMGCAPSSTPLHIAKFFPLATDCSIPTNIDDIFSYGGTLDVAPGSPSFQVGVEIVGGNLFAQQEFSANGQLLELENRNRPILDRIVLSYSAKPTSLGLQLAEAQYSRSVPLTTDGAALFQVNLISPQAADELTAKVAPGDDVELLVSVSARGYMSGDRAAVNTGPLVYPLRVIMSDPATCTRGFQQPDPTTTCLYPGQSYFGSPVVCCDQLVAGTPGCPP